MTVPVPDPDAVDAVAPVMRAVAEGTLSAADMARSAAERSRELFSDVVGQDDPLWPIQIDVARQVLALGGLPADELSQWLAVARQRDAEPSSEPQPADDPPEAVSTVSEPLRPDSDALAESVPDGEARADAVAVAVDPMPEDDEPPVEDRAEPQADPPDCGCGDTASATVTLADGRTIPTRLIAARGFATPADGLERL